MFRRFRVPYGKTLSRANTKAVRLLSRLTRGYGVAAIAAEQFTPLAGSTYNITSGVTASFSSIEVMRPPIVSFPYGFIIGEGAIPLFNDTLVVTTPPIPAFVDCHVVVVIDSPSDLNFTFAAELGVSISLVATGVGSLTLSQEVSTAGESIKIGIFSANNPTPGDPYEITIQAIGADSVGRTAQIIVIPIPYSASMDPLKGELFPGVTNSGTGTIYIDSMAEGVISYAPRANHRITVAATSSASDMTSGNTTLSTYTGPAIKSVVSLTYSLNTTGQLPNSTFSDTTSSYKALVALQILVRPYDSVGYPAIVSTTTTNFIPYTGGGAFNLITDSGNFTLSGQTVITKKGFLSRAVSASYSLIGQSALLKIGRLSRAASATYSLVGQSNRLIFGRRMTTASGSFSITGQVVRTLVGKVSRALSASYTLTGQVLNLIGTKVCTAPSATYTLVGTANRLLYGRVSRAVSAVYNLTGTNNVLKVARISRAASASYSLTGTSIPLKITRTIALSNGSFLLTGQNVILVKSGTAYVLTTANGSFSLSGQDARLLAARSIKTANGVFSLAGQVVRTLAGRVSRASSVSFSLSGTANRLLVARKSIATSMSYTLVGNDVRLIRNRNMVVTSGTFNLTGQVAVLRRGKGMVVSSGVFGLTGQNVRLIWSGSGPVWPLPSEVLLGVVYGPTGADYTGTLTGGGGIANIIKGGVFNL